MNQNEADSENVDANQVASDSDQTLADLEQYISGGGWARTGAASDKAARSLRAAETRDKAADARDRAAEAREHRAAESGSVDEAILALRALRIAGAYARQEAALLRGVAEIDREEAAALWRDAATAHRNKP